MVVEVGESQVTQAQNPLTARFRQFFEGAFIENINDLVKTYPTKKSLEIDQNMPKNPLF